MSTTPNVSRGAGPALLALVLLLGGCRGPEAEVEALWSDLALEGETEAFRPGMVEGLPEPAQRYLLWSMEPGTPLARSVELGMRGRIRLDPAEDPMPMQADQILAPPQGFVWRARVGERFIQIRGFDRYARGEGEMRWSLWGFLPLVQASGPDVTRSAAGRLAMEGVLLPSALLPGRDVEWEAVDEDRARFRMTVGEETVETTLEVGPEGRPVRASALRWFDDPVPVGAEEEREPGYELFVVELAGALRAGGYRIPSEVTAGWRLGEEDEFRFFEAVLERAVFR